MREDDGWQSQKHAKVLSDFIKEPVVDIEELCLI